MQDIDQLYEDLGSLAREMPSQRKTKLFGVVLDNNLVELIQKMWRRDLRENVLEEDEDFADYVENSMRVIHASYIVCM